MPSKSSQGLKRATSLIGDITDPEIYINPAPGNMQQTCFKEEELLPCRQN